MQVSSGRDSVHEFLSNISTLLARVKSANVGDASLSDLSHSVTDVEVDRTLSSRRADSSSVVPSMTSSLPLRSAVEQCPSSRPRRFHCESHLRAPSCTLRYSNPKETTAVSVTVITIVMYLSLEMTQCSHDTIIT